MNTFHEENLTDEVFNWNIPSTLTVNKKIKTSDWLTYSVTESFLQCYESGSGNIFSDPARMK